MGKSLTVELGFIFSKVSTIAPVPVVKMSHALGASTEPCWVCDITFLIWKVDLVHGMQQQERGASRVVDGNNQLH